VLAKNPAARTFKKVEPQGGGGGGGHDDGPNHT
jgi:hypothetical protein